MPLSNWNVYHVLPLTILLKAGVVTHCIGWGGTFNMKTKTMEGEDGPVFLLFVNGIKICARNKFQS